jgi:molybdenum cofactor guanylyltransferase
MLAHITDSVIGVILAGGLSRRMGGGDKGLRLLGGKSILRHVVERVVPQVGRVIVNANGDPGRFADLGLPVVPDSLPDFPGPLAGVLAGMEWARANAPDATHVATVAGDSPFVPRDLVARMAAELPKAQLVSVRSAGQDYPIIGLWPVALAGELRKAMVEEAMRKVDRWTQRYRLAVVEFAADRVDPFFNANAPEDLDEAERLLKLVKD